MNMGPQALAIYLDLLDHAADPAQMLVLSDALEEEGRDAVPLADAYRWAAARELWPFQRRRGRNGPSNLDELVWDWDRADRRWRVSGVPDCCLLPRPLYEAIRELPDRTYGSVNDAFVLLARGLAAVSASSQEVSAGEGKL